ncbi:MAG: FISUMP domain-containing protein [Syntrophomonas sp.]
MTLYKYILTHALNGTLELGYAPQEWDSDECFYERSTTYWGIFRSFSTKELTFIKNGATFLKAIFDVEGTEAICNYEVQELDVKDYTYKSRYIGLVDFSTYKYVQGSSGDYVKVQIIDNSLVNKIKTRESLDIALNKLTDLNGDTITPFTNEGKTIYIPGRTDRFNAEISVVDDVHLSDHAFPFVVVSKEENSVYDVVDYTDMTGKDGSFFSPIFNTDLSIHLTINAILDYDGGTNSVTINLRRWNSAGVFQENWLVGIFQNDPGNNWISIYVDADFSVPSCENGDYVIMEILHYGTGTLLTSNFDITGLLDYYRIITSSAYNVIGYPYHEAFTRILQAITGEASPFWSKILGRTDSEPITYAANGLLAHGVVTNGLLLRGFLFTDDNVLLKVSLKNLFQSLHAICPLCLGLEEFNGTWRVRIEEMRYAFNDTVFLSIEGAIDITEEVANDLTFSQVNIGFSKANNNPYNASKGRYEYNSQANYATPITTQENTLSALSPYRADGNGIFSALEKHKTIAAGEDSEYDDNNFLITYLSGSSQIEREENYATVENTGNDANNYNLFYHPARNLVRWGSFIRAALEKYTTKILSFLSSDYNSEAYTRKTGETDTIYEGRDINISDLDEPFFENIYYSFDFVVTPEVMAGMKQVTDHIPNQYMLVRFRANTDETYKYGWIMKFNSRKPDVKGLGSMKLLKANLTYVTPVIPAQVESIKYGALYNWYAVDDARNICAAGWHIPAEADIITLVDYFGEDNDAIHLKESGSTYWNNPNSNSDNSTGFNARGSGKRDYNGDSYIEIKETLNIWINEINNGYGVWVLTYSQEYSGVGYAYSPNWGRSLRPVKDSTTLTHGQTGTYTGNDGKVYRTICIGTQEWLADNLAETKYRDGSGIPIVTDNSAWAALTTGAMCYYDNDINNV